MVFPTGHAVGLTDRRGNEFLIHIGIDTVKLGGKGFTAHISQGDPVKRGDLLVEFDKKKLEKEGYDSTCLLYTSHCYSHNDLHISFSVFHSHSLFTTYNTAENDFTKVSEKIFQKVSLIS